MERIEYKIDIIKSKKIDFYKYLSYHKFKELHAGRIINSIYFDNANFDIYNDSVEGLSPRKKIRLRYYGNKILNSSDNNVQFEIKFTHQSGRSKKTNNINNPSDHLNLGFFDDKYGICFPKTVVSYVRKYYFIKQFRITLDENLSYSVFDKNFIKKKIFNSDEIIAEIKSNNINEIDNLKKLFPFKDTRFSKYCLSVEELNLI
jgi:SPX domain protein involved in polyphosphate accumulation